ncbi:MAG TPA: class III extradiol ring-cleavage dioxygenase [Anaeromyxobacteraceae bacterium]|nr:class III extradiol ring-cleavage dioxygenase [Anaeromyxobacteraceae bacterium]
MSARAPSVFISHGSPTEALEKDGYTAALGELGKRISPSAVVVVSAHWTTARGVGVTAAARHRLIYDFGGFPSELYRLEYPAPGDPRLAEAVAGRLVRAGFTAYLEPVRGLDHGAWIPLRLAWPKADVPVVQVSLPEAPPEELFLLGRALEPLRDEGVLVLGSGGIVHNLMLLQWNDHDAPPHAWAAEFDAWVAEHLARGDVESVLDYRDRAPHAVRAAPTTEHLDPLFVALGAGTEKERPFSIFEGFHYGSLGMRSFELREAA